LPDTVSGKDTAQNGSGLMNWLKKLFRSEANTSGDAVTSQELGEQLFNLCLRHVKSFLENLEQDSMQKVSKVKREQINQTELLLAFMWSYFDLMQVEKYEKTFARMHTCFIKFMTKLGHKENEIWHTLKTRYDEYHKSHTSKDKIDFTYRNVAHEICKNILDLETPNINPFLWLLVTTTLQENMLRTGKGIVSIPIKDS
jgi:hypothetical protein